MLHEAPTPDLLVDAATVPLAKIDRDCAEPSSDTHRTNPQRDAFPFESDDLWLDEAPLRVSAESRAIWLGAAARGKESIAPLDGNTPCEHKEHDSSGDKLPISRNPTLAGRDVQVCRSLVHNGPHILVRDRPGCELPRERPSSMTGRKRKHHGTHQDAHANLLIREHEAIAVVATADVINSSRPDQHTKLLNNHILIMSHQDEDTGVQDSHLSVDAAVNPPPLDTSAGLLRAVLSHYASNDGYVPLKTHVGWYLGLLRAYYQQDSPGDAASIAKQNLWQYVHLVSTPKMLLRAGSGMQRNGCNLFSVLTAQIESSALK